MKHLLATTLLSLFCCAANAEWSPLVEGVGNNSSMDVDLSTFKRTGDIVKIWARSDSDDVLDFNGLKYRSTITLYEINCKEDLTRSVYVDLYEGQKGEGKNVYSHNNPDAKWRPQPPKKFHTILANWVCAYKP